MSDKKTVLTRAGLQKLEDELSDLKINKRKEIAQKRKRRKRRKRKKEKE